MKTAIRLCALAVPLFVLLGWQSASSANLPKVKKETLQGRTVARAISGLPSTIGMNRRSYIAEVYSKREEPRLVKLSFRFLHYENDLPDSFFDYAVTHKFRAVRDTSCDEPLERMFYSDRFDSADHYLGREFTLKYAKGAPQFTIAPETILPCYILTPRDYQGEIAPKKSTGKQRT